MQVEESPPDQERLDLINAVVGDAVSLLDVDPELESAHAIMQKVNDAIVDLVFDRPTPVADDENPHLVLGALWGSQMARQFNWYWADVTIDGQFNEVAMISPNQEMIIFPFSFTSACIGKQCICTLLLAFNMLLENDRIGEIPPGTYENIMLSIHHIVPPYALESDG
ncbi:MAG: hypothetical protein AAGJ40_24605 [Planctomycetota bacterium]